MRRLLLLLAVPTVPILMSLEASGVTPTLGGSINLGLSDLLMLIVVAGYAFTVLRTHRLALGRVEGLLVVLLGTLLAASCFAYLRDATFPVLESIGAWLRLCIQGLYVFCVAGLVRTLQHERTFVRALWAYGLFCALNVYLSFGLGLFGINFGESQNVTINWGGTQRAFGYVGDVAGFLLVFYVAWTVVLQRYGWSAFFAAAILFTGTRGAIITMAVSTLALLTIRDVRMRMRVAPLLMALLVAVAGSFWLADRLDLTRRFVSEGASGNSVGQRWATWVVGARMVGASPAALVFGQGYQAYYFRAEDFGAAEVAGQSGLSWAEVGERAFANASNQYLQILVEGGVLALLLYVALFVAALRAFRRSARARPTLMPVMLGAWAWLLGLLLGNQWAVWMLPSSLVSLLAWALIGFALSTLRRAEVPQRAPARPLAAPVAAGFGPAAAGAL